MNKQDMFHQIFGNDAIFNQVNAAIARQGKDQVRLDVDDGDGAVFISFIDVPFVSMGETYYICAWVFHEGHGEKNRYEVLVKPSLSTHLHVIFSSEPPYESGESAYKMLSYAAICYAHDHNWRFPRSFPESALHPEMRPK